MKYYVEMYPSILLNHKFVLVCVSKNLICIVYNKVQLKQSSRTYGGDCVIKKVKASSAQRKDENESLTWVVNRRNQIMSEVTVLGLSIL